MIAYDVRRLINAGVTVFIKQDENWVRCSAKVCPISISPGKEYQVKIDTQGYRKFVVYKWRIWIPIQQETEMAGKDIVEAIREGKTVCVKVYEKTWLYAMRITDDTNTIKGHTAYDTNVYLSVLPEGKYNAYVVECSGYVEDGDDLYYLPSFTRYVVH